MLSRIVTTLLFAGAFALPAPAHALEFLFSADDAEVSYLPDNGVGSFTTALSITEMEIDESFPNSTGGFQMGLEHDGALLEIISAAPTGVLAEMSGGSGPGFFGPDYDPGNGDGIVLGVVYSLTTAVFLEFAEATEVIELTYQTVPEALAGDEVGRETSLHWVDTLGQPLITNTVVVNGQSTGAVFDDATVVLTPVLEVFLRGDADGNGTVFGLLDALAILEWFFTGASEPPCLDAADVDDNGTVSAIVDALILLQYSFTGGDAPPAPGPNACGADPTVDSVTCEVPQLFCPN